MSAMTRASVLRPGKVDPLRVLGWMVAAALKAAPLNLEQATRLANNAGTLSFQKLALQDEYGIRDTGDEFVICGWPDDTTAELLDNWRSDEWWRS
ncbi:hypothetical protein [Mycolicibacterium mucogenicum]|uniref:Uncharacterized protein n=1 Tax=Mycolicibacterium mucogenicum DSM 44124 TaxID=1226753 RepID=A0A8H2PJB8_MYCMU|nr:hypothetical protein [Mycolicibacterium mucogenicum]KAB7752899.1 hypothetical protein MMUC44124_26635 [Mycolicibacterium mucogenicum DSM 44124]QPG69117.1 hypothetical protein C1S78_027650 [Mycolicibacterium mucogenicum DSM 44124]